MFYNHLRQLVGQWDGHGESCCPTCAALLIPKRGDYVRWHWAHSPGNHQREGCSYEESAWHLRWKDVYLSLGWEVEMPIILGTQKYIIDAMNPKTGRVREFVHSLSPTYLAKHRALVAEKFDVLWIFDGGQWVSLRTKAVRKAGQKHFLKPSAYDLARKMNVLVHDYGRRNFTKILMNDNTFFFAYKPQPPALWREWKDNVWFRVEGDRSIKLLTCYAEQEMNVSKPPVGV